MKFLLRSLILLFIIVLPVSGYAQNESEVVVEISKEKAVINGKSYYLHTVKKGENIYRISKAYNVTQKDIILANPETISGSIKDGQILKIPAEHNAPRNIQQIESDNFIYHIAEEKQTVFFLTQKYKITEKELYKYNPELEFSSLQVGQIVKIPKSPNVPVGAEKFRPVEKYIEHKVGKTDTKYSISKQYNISVDELIAANPVLNSQDLQKGQILQIPVKSDSVIATVSVVKTDSVHFVSENNSKKSNPCDGFKPFSEPLQVALLMPVFIEGLQLQAALDSLNNQKRNPDNNETYLVSANLMEFYQGALIAVDSLKKLGLSVKLYVFDTGKDNTKLNLILSNPEMKKMDLIIGPLTKISSAVEKTGQFALANKIKMISPVLSDEKLINSNPYLFEINPSENSYADHIVDQIASMGEKNIILVNSQEVKDKVYYDLYKSRLEKSFAGKYKIYNYTTRNLKPLLSSTLPNIVIIPSEQRAMIQNVLNSLTYLSQKDSVQVFGLSSWSVLNGLDQENLYKLQFQYPSAFFIDFNSPAVKNFLSKYYTFYKSEPYFHTRETFSPQYFTKEGYNFAFLGYDITYYFLFSMGTMGKNFEDCIGHQKIDLLHTNIIFQRVNPQGGFINKGVNTIRYTKDFNVQSVD